LGAKIDGLFVEIIEGVMTAAFAEQSGKLPWVNRSIAKTDTIKIFLQIAWETADLENNQYAALAEPLEEIGRQLGGWRGQLLKQNSPNPKAGEK
jgi:hypothetical protein